VRFVTPVPAGSRIRLRQKLVKAEEVTDSGVRLTSEMVMEVEGHDKPAMVAETLSIVYA
jgi:acyl dehydratase